MLSLFVNFFHYNIEEFDRLTPRQAIEILRQREEIESNKYSYYDNVVRLINFYTIKSAFGDTKSIRKPQDLYQLSSDENDVDAERLVQKTRKPLTDFEKKLLNMP